MQQIADAAGVSRMTVSLALRNHPRITAETRERIQRIARDLGYRPDPEIAKLMAHLRRTRPSTHRSTIALLTAAGRPEPWRFNRHFAKFYEGAVRRADEMGYKLEEFWLKQPGLTGRRLTKILHTRSIEGLLIGPYARPSAHLSLDLAQFAAAEYGQNVWRPRLHRADHNQFQGVLLAIRQLRRLRYRRIGLVVLEGYDRRVMHAWEGAYLFCQQRIARPDRLPALVTRTVDFSFFARWFEKHRPEAVIASHLEVKDWLARLGVRLPQDAGFAYLDWLDESNACAGINQHYDQIAAAAVDLVVGQLRRNERGAPAFPKLVLIEGDWVDGPTAPRRPNNSRASR
jgi:LacI family transcriptional regulator